jgi:hypothetical protein
MNDYPAAGEPADDAQTPAANLAAVMRLAADGPYADVIAHETIRRRHVYDSLANSEDPLWAEIGTQLRDGQMELRDIWEVDAYSTHVIEAFDKHGSDYPTALGKTREQLEADQPTRP